MEQYYLISKSLIDALEAKLFVLNNGAHFIGNKGFENESETMIASIQEIYTIINKLQKCDVVPNSIFD